ncbi:MAG: hypothetical protein ACQCN3_02695 [Candidatus Bathyarchaeia archaeon]|jgi:Holliday junction resolvasome RuvABC ATP-dependent DNA helicase subunit
MQVETVKSKKKQQWRKLFTTVQVLKFCSTPKTIYTVAAGLHVQQSTLTELVEPLVSLKWLSKSVSRGRTFYGCTPDGLSYALAFEKLITKLEITLN